MTYIYIYTSPLGILTLSSDSHHITGLWLAEQKYFAATLEDHAEEKTLPIFVQTKKWLDIYFSGNDPGPTPPLLPKGTPFRLAVWTILQQLPYGTMTTYGAIAKYLERRWDKRVSARAVGGAVGHNPISILIPCHRVIGTNGNLTGYAGGIENKIRLLHLEGISTSGLFKPS